MPFLFNTIASVEFFEQYRFGTILFFMLSNFSLVRCICEGRKILRRIRITESIGCPDYGKVRTVMCTSISFRLYCQMRL